MFHFTRRDFLRTTGALALAPSIARAQQPLTVITPFGFIVDFIDLLNAQSGGHYKARGFEAKVIGGTGSATAIQQLIAGQAKFTRSAGIDLMKAAASQDLPLVSIGVLYQGSNFHMISHRLKPIQTAEDLRGKKIGVVSIGGATENFLDLMLAAANIKREDVSREVVGNNAGALQFVRQGRIDGFIASVNVVATLRAQKEDIEVFSTDKYAPMPSQVWVTLQQTIEREPDTVLRFCKAMRGSVTQLVNESFGPILDRVAKDFEIPGIRNRDGVVQTFTAMKELWLSQGRENLMRNVPKLWQQGADALARANIARVKNVQALYTNRFIDEALKA